MPELDAHVRAQTLVDLVPVPALITRAGVCVAVNASYRELTGISSDAVVGLTTERLILDRIAAGDRALVAQASARSGGRGHLWCRVRDDAGRERPVRVIWNPGPGEGEVLTLLFDAEPDAFGRDMADALARAAGQLGSCAGEDQVLERAADALSAHGLTTTVLLIDGDAPLLRYGPTRSPRRAAPDRAAARWRGQPPPRAVLEAFNPGFPQRRAAFFQDGMRLVRDAFSEPVAAELVAVLPSERMVQAPLFVDGEPYGALVVTGDLLTPVLAGAIELFAELVARALENVRLRAARIERERLAALGEAAAVMAHEVRNPVGALLNAAAILQRAGSDAVRAQMIEIIGEEAARLERLVEDLLALGRPIAPRFGAVALAAVREAAIALLSRRGELDAVHVEEHVEEGGGDALAPSLARADAELIQLALSNLLRNAAQSSPPGGRVRASLAREADRCGLIVEDEGPGFSDEAALRLSEPFFTTRASGTGLGLALVRRVVDAHGGELTVRRSEALGGARVEMWLRPARAEE